MRRDVMQMCTDGKNCNRRVCFFAHDESEIRTQPVDANAADSDSGDKGEFSNAGEINLQIELHLFGMEWSEFFPFDSASRPHCL